MIELSSGVLLAFYLVTQLFIIPFAIIGLWMIFKTLIMPMKQPADTSNRIAHLRLVWWAISRPELFINQAPWLARDEKENLRF